LSSSWTLPYPTRSQVGAEVVECACVVEMPDLGGRKKLGGVPLYAQVQKEGD